ncbi:hypothetical protein TRAPUB_3354 [Trametes pubescens]|uniref:Uncharacterized protein n=1 Tax=Trametes pubescens TaxID=154538 RepID=A0A1M2VDV9_TRAPU|nr:hypothetical protein TRAPUB_3354 [Trametes pubescens]
MFFPHGRLDVVPLVRGVSNPAFQGFPDWGSANDAFEEAYARGETKIVRDGPPKSERPKQEPRRSGGTRSTGTRSSTTLSSAGRAARDAIIAETLEAARRESRHNSTSGVRDNAQGPSTRSMTRAQAQAMQQVPPRQSAPRTQPVLPSGMPQGGRNSKSTSSNPSTSSSPPTCVTQRETSQSPLYARSPRYAQSLSYASDTSPAIQSDVHMASPATGSSALASGDCRTDVSSPSTNTTKYFPADFATRPRDAYTKMRERDAAKLLVRSPATTVSEYATPSGSAQTRQSDLSPLTSGNPMPPPATQSTVVQSPVTPVSSGTKTRRRKVGKDYSDASIQVDCPIRKRVYTAAQVQASDERQFAAAEVQTSPALWGRTMPPHTSASSTGGVSDGGQLEGEFCGKPHRDADAGLPRRVCRTLGGALFCCVSGAAFVCLDSSQALCCRASGGAFFWIIPGGAFFHVIPSVALRCGVSDVARFCLVSDEAFFGRIPDLALVHHVYDVLLVAHRVHRARLVPAVLLGKHFASFVPFGTVVVSAVFAWRLHPSVRI